MTPFQYISIILLAAMFARELLGFWRGGYPLVSPRGLRTLVWLAAIVCIARPDLVQSCAEMAGIDRGADFVFYLFVLAFLGVTFYFYSRFVRMQRHMTQLVRHIAIQEAEHGANPR